MKILQIANSYANNPMYSSFFSCLEGLGTENYIFDALGYNDIHSEVSTEHLHVKKCFSTFDRVLFYTKQRNMLKCIENHFDISQFDIIHAHTLFSGGYSAYKLNQKHGIPYVVAIRNVDVNIFFKYMMHLRGVGMKILQHAKAVIFLSSAYRDVVFSKYVPDSLRQEIMLKTYIIPNGIDDFWHQNKFDSLHVVHWPLRLIYAGEITKNKNIMTTIKAMEILKQKGIEVNLTVVGPVKDKVVFDSFINHPQVVYHDAVPKEKLIDFYRDVDIFVMPSFAETFGLVYAEAMSQGLPVLYSKGQGFDGQFEEGQVGFAVDSHSAEDVANKIELVCKNYSQLSKNAVENVNKFRWNKIAEEYRGLYGER